MSENLRKAVFNSDEEFEVYFKKNNKLRNKVKFILMAFFVYVPSFFIWHKFGLNVQATFLAGMIYGWLVWVSIEVICYKFIN
jgi:hypothetical protein